MTLAADLEALGDAPTLAQARAVAERWALRGALVRASGNVRRAAVALGISYAQAHRLIDSAGLREWLTEEYERGARQPPKKI
jgi:molybdenum-dependent DNA-binding transcriptional regulator ModE